MHNPQRSICQHYKKRILYALQDPDLTQLDDYVKYDTLRYGVTVIKHHMFSCTGKYQGNYPDELIKLVGKTKYYSNPDLHIQEMHLQKI
jgi:hypothetical protein